MTVETQMLRAVEGGAVFTFARLCAVAHCTPSRGLRAVRVLMDLGLLGHGRFDGTKKRMRSVFFAPVHRRMAA